MLFFFIVLTIIWFIFSVLNFGLWYLGPEEEYPVQRTVWALAWVFLILFVATGFITGWLLDHSKLGIF